MTLGARLRRDGTAWFVGAVLLGAGLLKAGRPLEFGRVIEGYQLLPASGVPTAAAVLPWLEVLLGALLLGGQFRLGAAALAALLSAGFLGAAISILARGIETQCGCFGDWSGPVGAATLTLDTVLLAAAAWTLRTAWRAAAPVSP